MSVIYRYVLVFVDRLIKMRHLILIVPMKIKEVINSFYARVWKHHDLSKFFVFDKDTQFIFDVWEHLCKMLKIDVKLFIAYHSEIDDQTERVNAVMKYYFRVFVNYMQNDWVKWLSSIEFAINNASFLITLTFLFLVNFEQNSRLKFEFFESLFAKLTTQSRVKLINIEKFIKKMKEFTEHLRDEMLIAQVIYEFNINRSRRSCSKYFVENQIWLNARNLNITRSAIKLNDRYVDFFSIKRVFDKNSLIIELELSVFMKIHSIFYVIFLNHIVTDSLSSQILESRESLIVENDERIWYVNNILNFKRDRRYNSSLLKYYVDWEDHFLFENSFMFWIIVNKLLTNIIKSISSSKTHISSRVWFLIVNVTIFSSNLI